jgi:hypothetical protein
MENIIDASQSEPTLPVEILAQTFQDYFAFRNKEIQFILYVTLAIVQSGGFREHHQELFNSRKYRLAKRSMILG